MRLSLGIFDVFTYAIPGSLYLAFGLYVGARMDWIDPGKLDDVPTLLLAGGIVVISYVIGHLTYLAGTIVDRVFPFWVKTSAHARRRFLDKMPQAADRPFMNVSATVLLTAIERYDKDAALEVLRLRAAGLMVRNCFPPFLAGCVAAIVEAVGDHHRPTAIVCAVLLGLAALVSVPENQKLRDWANHKTLEACFWTPEIDEVLRPPEPAPRPVRQGLWRRLTSA
ncbi:hypothetical protein J4573_15720 [Actinomadura barringtoniae]|uniref:Uncharacterized protein n=1 Tax=Actinomadura barringtoniae TaxID=1427535 RepID=A0A939T1Y9_9ACTN|nr:hypothetical protein [Actinomadura barringtoniae]MBO2448551.1 hypothetical protein [Actinomadura barringtoniae]